MTSHEKPARKPRDWLEVSSTLLRVVQWMSACFVYTTVYLRLSHVIYAGEDISRVRAIKPLMTLTLVYSTLGLLVTSVLKTSEKLKASSWHAFTIASLPADMVMLGAAAAQFVILNIRTFECAAVLRAGNGKTHYLLDANGNANGWFHSESSEYDSSQCLFPRGVYCMCIITIFSYITTIMLNVARLLQFRKPTITEKDEWSPSFLEGQNWPYNQMVEDIHRPSSPVSVHSVRSLERRALPQRPAPVIEPKYANLPAEILANMVVTPFQGNEEPTDRRFAETTPRASYETSASLDPDHYIVSDGFQPPEEPPALINIALSEINPVNAWQPSG
ncbi:hypothetical protein DL546_009346 [Coniochaeta pulveracea]|uniref:Uncharacterized protein n=1 Tax=Coniochaeta pulveracea TaxID=177199 RepID=A0A420YL87_9PEZI|nr:hypothetical protein DL546_009346 [Coniochaeta pulveracea]